jgi:hypothetical protein
LGLLALSGIATESLASGNVHASLWLLAIGGGALGIVLGTLRTADSLAHVLAIGIGAAGTIAFTAYLQSPAAESLTFLERVRQIGGNLRDWYLGATPQDELEQLLVMILLQLIVWLVSYLSAWSLARQRWLTVALVLPAILLLGSMLFGSGTRDGLLELYLIVAIVLLARVTYVRRHHGHGPSSEQKDGAGWGLSSLLPAFVIALLVVGVGTAAPAGFSSSAVRPMAEYASSQYIEAQDRTLDWISGKLDLSGSGPASLDSFPRYTAFDDAFSVGGDLNLSDRPEVLVRTQSVAPYLSAQSYDSYTGRGWESTVEDTFEAERPDGVRYSPELTFRPGQELPYSFDERISVPMEVTSLTPVGETMFNSGMYQTADERASVRMSWMQLDDEPFLLRAMDLSSIPPDLTGVASLLLQASDLSEEGESGLLYPADSADRERLLSVQRQLEDRFIGVRWTVADEGRIDTMLVTGQVPVYEDNVRVSRAEGAGQGQTYSVTSLASEATPDQLRQANDDYPEWVTSRYLELPDSVTDRTVNLALEIGGQGENPYDRAKAIEAFLREHIAYDLDVGLPPDDADIVDHVLFEQRRGYCEYYASAMTVMLRALGIPAKTVVGYFPAEFDPEADGYLYRQENAHAWTEAWFPDYGWIRFEPTSAQPESTFGELEITDTPTPTPTPTPILPGSTPEPIPTATPEPVRSEPDMDLPEVVTEGSGDDGGFPWLPAGLAAALGLAAVGAETWFLMARTSMTSPQSLFASLVRWGKAGGVRHDPVSTPREYARRVGRRYPDVRPEAYEVVDAYEEYRYGNVAPSSSSVEHAAMSLRHLRRRVLRSVIRRR